jgi:hypothetical protein
LPSAPSKEVPIRQELVASRYVPARCDLSVGRYIRRKLLASRYVPAHWELSASRDIPGEQVYIPAHREVPVIR